MSQIYYRPVMATSLTHDNSRDFATLYPEHVSWLAEHEVSYQISILVWPSLLSGLVRGQIGMEICEVMLEIADEHHANMFAEYSKTILL